MPEEIAVTTILYAVEDRIATITLHRPDRMNALTYPMALALREAIRRASKDDEVGAIIVTGAGDRAFCAGADISGGEASFDYDTRDDRQAREHVDGVYRDSGGMVALEIFDCLKPVIGAINGVAVGFGASVILPMDVRIAADDARFGFVFARRGIVPESASTWFLPRIVGIATALDWCYSGRVFGAEEALNRSLVQSIHPRGDLIAVARAIARSYIDHSAPVSIALTRQMLWRMLGADHPMVAHRLDSRGVTARGRSADAREGVIAFREKRPPAFPDAVSTGMPDFYPWWEEPIFR
jgi:enoyl-CoA hydratase/carnithine racemase